MLLSIVQYTRLKVIKVEVDNVIKFLDSHNLGLESGGQLNNDNDFLKKYLTISKIL